MVSPRVSQGSERGLQQCAAAGQPHGPQPQALHVSSLCLISQEQSKKVHKSTPKEFYSAATHPAVPSSHLAAQSYSGAPVHLPSLPPLHMAITTKLSSGLCHVENDDGGGGKLGIGGFAAYLASQHGACSNPTGPSDMHVGHQAMGPLFPRGTAHPPLLDNLRWARGSRHCSLLRSPQYTHP